MVDAAFMAGAGLAALDPIARLDAPWAGVWRQRLALRAAAVSMKLMGRGEDEKSLRDAFFLRRAGDDPGPAGRALIGWRSLVARGTDISTDGMKRAAQAFGMKSHEAAGETAEEAYEIVRSAAQPIAAATSVSSLVMERHRDGLLLALWAADQALAIKMRWPIAVPLLALEFQHRSLKVGADGKRPRPGEAGWERIVAIAVALGSAAAIDSAGVLARSAEKLEAAAPKLRTKGAGEAIALLLKEDAVTPANAGTRSDRGGRRLFDRLVSLGAVRELSGRPTFRLYGL